MSFRYDSKFPRRAPTDYLPSSYPATPFVITLESGPRWEGDKTNPMLWKTLKFSRMPSLKVLQEHGIDFQESRGDRLTIEDVSKELFNAIQCRAIT